MLEQSGSCEQPGYSSDATCLQFGRYAGVLVISEQTLFELIPKLPMYTVLRPVFLVFSYVTYDSHVFVWSISSLQCGTGLLGDRRVPGAHAGA